MTGSTTRTVETPLIIGGKEIATAARLEVRDPANPSVVVGHAAAATAEQAASAVRAADDAWPAWAALLPQERANAVVAALDALQDSHDQRVGLLVRENGKPRFEADIDLRVFESRTRQAAGLAGELSDVRHLAGPPLRSEVHALSLGVVSVIVPFNWPLAILAASLPYALVAGNTVVVKPPPTAPLATVATLQLFAGQLPPGVVNVVTGSNESVAPVILDPVVRWVGLHRQHSRRQADHDDGRTEPDAGDPRAGG